MEKNGLERRSINLAAIEHLVAFVSDNDLTSHCQHILVQGAFAEEFHFVLSDKEIDLTADESAGILLPFFNKAEFKTAFIRLWSEASFYLNTFGLVVVGIYKDLKRWLVDAAETGEIASQLPLHVVDLVASRQSGKLDFVETTAGGFEFIYTPPETATTRNFEYYVYRAPIQAFASPVSFERLDVTDVGETLKKLVGPKEEKLSLASQFPLGARQRTTKWYLRSRFWHILRIGANLRELVENTLDADGNNARPLQYFAKRQRPPVQPDMISRPGRSLTGNVRADDAIERAQDVALGFRYGKQWAIDNLIPPPTHMTSQGTLESKGAALREKLGRASLNDDAVLLPEDIETKAITAPKTIVNISEWREHFAAVVAHAYNIPVEYLKDAPLRKMGTGSSKKSAGQGQGTSGDPRVSRQLASEQLMEETLKMQRKNAAWFFTWLYQKTYANFDMLLISLVAERMNDFELTALHDGLAGLTPTKQDRRRNLRDALLARAAGLHKSIPVEKPKEKEKEEKEKDKKKEKGLGKEMKMGEEGKETKTEKESEEEEEEEEEKKKKQKKKPDASVTLTELRWLIHERVKASTAPLKGTLFFHADLVAEELVREEEKIDPVLLDLRLKTLTLLQRDVATGVIDRESYHKAIKELLGLTVKGGPMQMMGGGGGGGPMQQRGPGGGGAPPPRPKKRKANEMEKEKEKKKPKPKEKSDEKEKEKKPAKEDGDKDKEKKKKNKDKEKKQDKEKDDDKGKEPKKKKARTED